MPNLTSRRFRGAPGPLLPTERPDPADETLHDFLGKLELRHAAFAAEDRGGDLLVADLRLPLLAPEIRGLEHGALRAVAMTGRAVARLALVLPRHVDEHGNAAAFTAGDARALVGSGDARAPIFAVVIDGRPLLQAGRRRSAIAAEGGACGEGNDHDNGKERPHPVSPLYAIPSRGGTS